MTSMIFKSHNKFSFHQQKSLWVNSFLWFIPFVMIMSWSPALHALPDKYQIIAKDPVKTFTFQEDQPWANPPETIDFCDRLQKGKVVILHLWATSCPSCVGELKSLEDFAKTYKKQNLDIITLSLNDPRSGVLRNYFSRNHYRHIKPYHRASSTRPNIRGLPTTLFFNTSGHLIGKIEGVAPWSSDEMHRLVTRLMAEEPQHPEDSVSFAGILSAIQNWFS